MSGAYCLSDFFRVMVYTASDVIGWELRTVAEQIVAAMKKGERVGDAFQRALNDNPWSRKFLYFDASDKRNGFGLREEYLEPAADPISRLVCVDQFNARTERYALQGDEPYALIEAFGKLISAKRELAEVEAAVPERFRNAFKGFVERRLVLKASERAPGFLKTERDGIYRLQHSCLLFKDAEKSLLIDPTFHASFIDGATHDYSLFDNYIRFDDVDRCVSAVLLSHSHPDHYHLPTLAAFPRETTIVLPKLEKPSFISRHMARELRRLGFSSVVELEWYERLRIGSFEIQSLPFYGEQPARYSPARLWQAGNTYLIKHPEYSCFVGVDTGADFRGSQLDVARRVREEHGSVDFVATNLRPQVIGDSVVYGGMQYWLTLTAEQIAEFLSWAKHDLTLGPEGAAEICAILDAKLFLPYAHWYGEPLKTNPTDVALTARLHDALSARKCRTAIAPWRMGERLSV